MTVSGKVRKVEMRRVSIELLGLGDLAAARTPEQAHYGARGAVGRPPLLPRWACGHVPAGAGARAGRPAGRGRGCRGRSGSVVLVLGEAGIGKTSLLRAFLDGVSGSAAVLSGSCDDLLTPRALGPLRDAARGRGAARRCARRGQPRCRLLGSDRRAVRRTAPHRAGGGGRALGRQRDPGRRPVRRQADRRTARRIAAQLPRRRARPGASPAWRPRRTDRPAGAALGAAAAEPGRSIGPRRAHRRRSRGAAPTDRRKPVLRHRGPRRARAGGAVHRRRRRAGPVEPVEPGRAGMPGPARRRARPGGPAAAAALFDDLAPIAEAEALGVLEVGPDAVAFRHELARRAVADSLPASIRRQLDARVLRVLLDRDDPDLSRVLHHAVSAGDDAAVAAFGPAAARDASFAGAHRRPLPATSRCCAATC